MLIGSGGRCDGETGVSPGHLPDMCHDWSIDGGPGNARNYSMDIGQEHVEIRHTTPFFCRSFFEEKIIVRQCPVSNRKWPIYLGTLFLS